MQLSKSYQLVRKIAAGGMAEVFLARTDGPKGFSKTLVLKRILPQLAEDEQFVEMFLGEARLAAQLSHPNVVQIFDFGEFEGSYYIAMEFIDGPNLRTLGRQAARVSEKLAPALCAKIISYACEGLAYAHDFVSPETGQPLGLIHRDVSADNILVSRNGAVKVVDFGIAKVIGQSQHTKTGTIKGKLPYMPPEQLRGKPLDRRVDVFALGMVLYELLSGGKRPYDATGEMDIMNAILREPQKPIRQRRPDVPVALEQILQRAMAKNREERYPSCRELRADLERFILSEGEPVGTYEVASLVTRLLSAGKGPAAGEAAAKAGEKAVPTPATRRGKGVPPPLLREAVAPSKPTPPPLSPARTEPVPVLQRAVEKPAPVEPVKKGAESSSPWSSSLSTVATPGKGVRWRWAAGVLFSVLGCLSLAVAGSLWVPRWWPAVRVEKVVQALGVAESPERPVEAVEAPAESVPPVGAAAAPSEPQASPEHPPSASPPVASPASPASPPEPGAQVEERKLPHPPPPPEEPSAPNNAHKSLKGSASARPGKARGPERVHATESQEEEQTEEAPEEATSSEPEANPEPPEAPPALASVIFESSPPAQIRVNGRFAGFSPVTMRHVPPGSVSVEAYDSVRGFAKQQGFVLEPGENGTKRIVVERGTLKLRVKPGWAVYLDGQYVGRTPLEPLQVYEGPHEIRLENAVLKGSLRETVKIEPGRTSEVRLNLEP